MQALGGGKLNVILKQLGVDPSNDLDLIFLTPGTY